MFRLFSKLFSKKNPVVPQWCAAQLSLKEVMSEVRFRLYVIICISLFTAILAYSYSYINKVTRDSIEASQTIMVNVLTDRVLIGYEYKDIEASSSEPEIEVKEY